MKKICLLITIFILFCCTVTVYADEFTISQTKATINAGDIIELDVSGTEKTPVWTSYNVNVAKVDQNGIVTAVKKGKTTISARVGLSYKKCTITVVNPNIKINKATATVYTGKALKLKATVTGTDKAVLWNSENPQIAVVSAEGVVTPVSAGTATITATANGKTAVSRITVIEKNSSAESTLDIKDDAVNLKTKGADKTYTLGYSISGKSSSVKWQSSDKTVASVSKGKVTAKKAGTAVITATANGVSDTVAVTVNDYDPTITLNQNEYTLYTGKGNTVTLKATVDGASKTVTWKSSDISVATVTNKGKVTAVKEGQTLITATANGVTAECLITVKESKVILETENIHLDKGETANIPADVTGINQTIKYATTNSKVAAIKKGIITAKGYGEADIKVTANGVTALCHVKVSDCKHSFDEGAITKESTCIETGIKTYTCSICGYAYTETIEKAAHDWKETDRLEAGCETRGTVSYTCAVCGATKQEILEPLGHEYGEWVIDTEPTETTEGLEKQSCIRCGIENTRTIPNKTHEHKYTSTVAVPTCTEQGYTTYTCACGDSYTDDYTDALGHDWTEWEITKEPTATEKGEKKRICNRCKEEETVQIPEISHEHKYITVVTEPTCTEQGYATYTCECGDYYISDYTDVLGHSWGEWITTKKPTEAETGEKKHICDRCQIEETEIIPKTEHIHSYTSSVTTPTCTTDGYTTYTCTECGYSYKADYVAATGHTEGNWQVIKEPTCVEAGTEEKQCTVCGYTIDTKTIEKTGHDYVETIINEPTCTETGLKALVCSVCGNKIGETSIPASHSWGDWTITKEPSSTAAETTDDFGLREHECSVCYEKQEEIIINIDLGDGNTKTIYGTFDDDEAYKTFAMINELRASLGLNELQWFEKFTDITHIRAVELSYSFAHERPRGGKATYVVSLGLEIGLGENIAMGYFKSAADVFDAWKNSSGHYANMIHPSYTKYFCACFYEDGNNDWSYWVQIFTNVGSSNTKQTCAHDDGEWVITKEPEAGVDGEKELKCTKCGYVFDTEIIEMLPVEEASETETSQEDNEESIEEELSESEDSNNNDDEIQESSDMIIVSSEESSLEEMETEIFEELEITNTEDVLVEETSETE